MQMLMLSDIHERENIKKGNNNVSATIFYLLTDHKSRAPSKNSLWSNTAKRLAMEQSNQVQCKLNIHALFSAGRQEGIE